MTTAVRCSYAGCQSTPNHYDDVDRWFFCGQHWREHLTLVAEERGRPCGECGTYFHSDTAQRRLCDRCSAERRHDRRPSFKDRKKAS